MVHVPITVMIYHQFYVSENIASFVKIKQFHYHLKSFSALVTENYSLFANALIDLEKGINYKTNLPTGDNIYNQYIKFY